MIPPSSWMFTNLFRAVLANHELGGIDGTSKCVPERRLVEELKQSWQMYIVHSINHYTYNTTAVDFYTITYTNSFCSKHSIKHNAHISLLTFPDYDLAK